MVLTVWRFEGETVFSNADLGARPAHQFRDVAMAEALVDRHAAGVGQAKGAPNRSSGKEFR